MQVTIHLADLLLDRLLPWLVCATYCWHWLDNEEQAKPGLLSAVTKNSNLRDVQVP